MPNQDRNFVLVFPKLKTTHTFAGHGPRQAANKAFTCLRKAGKVKTGKTLVFIIRETGTTKELTYSGEYKKLKNRKVITLGDGQYVVEYENKVYRELEEGYREKKRSSSSKSKKSKSSKSKSKKSSPTKKRARKSSASRKSRATRKSGSSKRRRR